MESSFRVLPIVERPTGGCIHQGFGDFSQLDGPGHFLGHGDTLARMQSDYFYPALADRRTPQEWAASEETDLLARARARTRELLEAPWPEHIPAEVDAAIRARFPIRLEQ